MHAPVCTSNTQFIRSYLLFKVIHDISEISDDYDGLCQHFALDVQLIHSICTTCYLCGHHPHILKLGNLHLAFEYAKNHEDHHHFVQMLHMSPQAFDILVQLIKDHPAFHNESNQVQAPVETQLAVTLYRMGWYGNGVSLGDVARIAGVSDGSVQNFTKQCFDAIESLHDLFVRPLTQEKDVEKRWLDHHLGFSGGHW